MGWLVRRRMDMKIKWHRRLLPALIFACAAVVAAGCGGSSDSTTGGGSASGHGKFAGAEASPPKPAAPLELDNSLGEPVNLREYQGKAVLVTFIYTHCPDVCPLIVSHLKTAQAMLGPKADKLQIVAVSTDPRGDNPKTVAAFLHDHGMTGRMQYLIGNKAELGHVWKEWNIVSHPAKAGRDLVEHSALVYGIGADGKITTLYPANFSPSEIAHDVPLLEQQ
jgi:protein SCO1/2